MHLTTLASSSSGNCVLVSQGKTHILIDAGISCKRICESLRALSVEPSDISAVIVTHAHSDHINGLRTLSRSFFPKIYASGQTLAAVESSAAPKTELCEIEPGEAFAVRELEISSFRTSHDSPGSVGFTVTYGGRKLVLATDLGIVTPEVADAARGATLAIIEANHDLTMLKYGPYPPTLKRRISSDVGHLSNIACGAFALGLVKSGTESLVLAHLSRENNTPELALRDVRSALINGGVSIGTDVRLAVAPHFTPGERVAV
jgi:phosphoribosyl 1,2-cyclic phosphodiesterase